MRTVEMKLHPDWQNYTGHCQITYISKNDDGQKIVHCLQEYDGIRFMRCSQDGEPSHEIIINDFSEVQFKFELPPGDSRLEVLCRDWIFNYEGGKK